MTVAAKPQLGQRKFRLHRVAKRLKPWPEALPYYLHNGRSEHEKAPGWYMIPAGHEFPFYLADNSVDAEIELRRMVAEQGDQAA